MGFGRSENLGKENKFRIWTLGLFIFLIFFILIGRLFSLQVVNGFIYLNRSRAVSRRTITIPSQRGKIYDKNHDTPLVDNVDSFSLFLIPGELKSETPEDIINRLHNVLKLPDSVINEVYSKIPLNWRNVYTPIELLTGLDLHDITPIAENKELYPGVSWESRPLRYYNTEGSLAHVLGYVGKINYEELQILYNQGYTANSILGKSGIEKTYDHYLKGEDGFKYNTVDVQGRNLEREGTITPPANGYDLVLTIDRDIQSLVESAIGEHLGSAVVLKPSTGEILAMASYPSFNPNEFTEPGPNNFNSLSLNPQFPFLNRAIQSAYPTASTSKIMMTLATLAEKAFPADKLINCTGSMELGNRTFHCHKLTGHGRLNLMEALGESCNVYFGTVGVDYLGIDNIYYYNDLFGFGAPSGIDLEGEVSGINPNPQWKEQVYNTPWTLGDTLNSSIGQGFMLATPLQAANMCAMIVNDGKMYRPHLLSEVIDPDTNEVIYDAEPELIRNVSDMIDQDVFDQTKEAMRFVVTNGTARLGIMTDDVAVAGKTGTGEVGSDENWHAWFVSYGPYDAPVEDQVVVVTQIEAYNDEWDWWAIKAADIIYGGIFGNRTFEEEVQHKKEQRVWYAWDIPLDEEEE
ncbi:MAG: penicillin-binding protein 2 [Spirochaetales bacterium]|nr:penicillin-binding protein 2 [Spirochaetales bacterium]